MSVGIVVPAYSPDPDRLCSYARTVDDRLSPDAIRIELDAADRETRDRIDALAATVSSVESATAADRRGKGTAITAGFEALSTDVLAFADADGSTPAADLGRVVDAIADGDTDLAVGSRRHPEATVDDHQTRVRRTLGDGYAAFARALLGPQLHDYQCGAKAIHADAWRAVRDELREPGFAWDVEVIALAGAHGLEVREVPVEWVDRPGSTVSPIRDGLRMARGLVVAAHRARCVEGSRLHRSIARLAPDSAAVLDRTGRPGDDRPMAEAD